MVGTISAVVLLVIISYLLLRYGPASARSRQGRILLYAAVGAVCLLFLVTALVTLNARDRSRAVTELQLLESAPEIEAAMGDQYVLIKARVSEENNLRIDNYAAFVRFIDRVGEEDDDTEYYLPELLLRLSDGLTVSADQQTYAPLDWNVSADAEYRYLRPGDHVLVFGNPYTGYVLTGSQAGERLHVAAEFIYLGNHDQFVSSYGATYAHQARQYDAIGKLALLAALIVPAVAVIRWRRVSLS